MPRAEASIAPSCTVPAAFKYKREGSALGLGYYLVAYLLKDRRQEDPEPCKIEEKISC